MLLYNYKIAKFRLTGLCGEFTFCGREDCNEGRRDEKIDVFGIESSLKSCKGQNLEDVEDYTYDQKFKQLFTNKKLLTPILKNIIPEYADCTLEEIERLINPHGCTEVNPKVYSSEDSGKGNETTTYYDVLVDCALPNKQEVCVDLFFDLEMQREGNIGYLLVKRGIYYC